MLEMLVNLLHHTFRRYLCREVNKLFSQRFEKVTEGLLVTLTGFLKLGLMLFTLLGYFGLQGGFPFLCCPQPLTQIIDQFVGTED